MKRRKIGYHDRTIGDDKNMRKRCHKRPEIEGRYSLAALVADQKIRSGAYLERLDYAIDFPYYTFDNI
jgi:hypothetical protein